VTRKIIKAHPYQVPRLDVAEFELLYDLLWEAFNQMDSPVARALDISPVTWRRWKAKPPTWGYWNYVMIHVLRTRLMAMNVQRKGFTQKQFWYIKRQLGQLKGGADIEKYLVDETQKAHSAEDHLRRLLAKKGMFWDEICRGKTGGHTQRALQRAAKRIGIVKKREGFGEDGRSYWRLPTLESDEDQED